MYRGAEPPPFNPLELGRDHVGQALDLGCLQLYLKADNAILHALSARSPRLPKIMESQLHIAYVVSKVRYTSRPIRELFDRLLPAPHTLVRALDTELSVLESRYSNM